MDLRKELGRIGQAVRGTLKPKRRVVALLVLTVMTYVLFLYIPVRLTPGNDFPFQLSIMRLSDHALLVTLAILNSLLILMHWQIFRTKRTGSVGHVAVSGAGGLSAAFASMLGTASCSSCVAGILGFLGTGSILFVLNNRTPLTVAAVSLVFVAIYMVARRMEGACQSCEGKR